MTEEVATTDAVESPETGVTETGQEQTKTDTAAVVDGAATDQQDAGADKGTLEGGDQGKEAAPPAEGELEKFRSLLAGNDEGLKKSLDRYKSVESIREAFKEARAAAKNAGKVLTLGDKATDEEVAAYRKAAGIPDDPAEYPVSFREDFQASEADGEILGGFKNYMHDKAGDPRTAKIAVEWFQDFQQAQVQELNKRLNDVAKSTQTELRNEWGGEYDGNIGAVQEFMTAKLGKDGFGDMMDMRLIDGSRLQDNPAFVKMMAEVATDYYGSNAIYHGDVETTGKTLQERLDTLMQLRVTDPEKYKSPQVQEEVMKLFAQKQKLESRK